MAPFRPTAADRVGVHNPDCNCRPGSDENGWHEKRDARCVKADRDEFAYAMQQWQEHWPTRAECDRYEVIHNEIRLVGDLS